MINGNATYYEALEFLENYAEIIKLHDDSCRELKSEIHSTFDAYSKIPEFGALLKGADDALDGVQLMRASIARIIDQSAVKLLPADDTIADEVFFGPSSQQVGRRFRIVPSILRALRGLRSRIKSCRLRLSTTRAPSKEPE